jgi:hypothetical protein
MAQHEAEVRWNMTRITTEREPRLSRFENRVCALLCFAAGAQGRRVIAAVGTPGGERYGGCGEGFA